jgi:hypothetical protein
MYEGRIRGNTRECILDDDGVARKQFGVGWILLLRPSVESFAVLRGISVAEAVEALWDVYKRVYMPYQYSVNTPPPSGKTDQQWVELLQTLATNRIRQRQQDSEQLRRVYSTQRNTSRPPQHALVVREPMRPRVVAGAMAPSYMCSYHDQAGFDDDD